MTQAAAERRVIPEEIVRLAHGIRAEVAEQLAMTGSALGDAVAGGEGPADHSRRPAERARQLASRAVERRAAAMLAGGSAPLDRTEEETVVELVGAMLFGLGALQLYIDDESVENIDVNGAARAFVTYADGRKVLVGRVAASDEELVGLVRTAAARFGLAERRFDSAQPELDLRLPDGSRLSAVMGVTEHPVIDVRRHRIADHDLDDLVGLGMLGEELAGFLRAAVLAKRNVLVSGAMNAGKTTLLRALAAEIPPRERIVTIEQALELGLDRQAQRHPDCVAMEARLANTEGVGAIGMAQLVRRSLRMNASRVIVGEVLGDEIIPMLNAMSQGRSGSMGTIHADSSAGVFRRIAAYAVQAPEHLPLEATNLLIAGAIHFVVHVEMTDASLSGRAGGVRPAAAAGRVRRIVSVREVVDAEGAVVVSNEVWRPGADGLAHLGAPLRDVTAAALAEHGYDTRSYRPAAVG